MSWFWTAPEEKKPLKDEDFHFTMPTEKDFDFYREEALVTSKTEWTSVHDDDGIKVWYKKPEGTSINMIKVHTIFECDPKLMYDVIADDEYFMECMRDELFAEWRVVENISEKHVLSYYATKSPFPLISGRDFLNLKSYHVTDKEFFITLKSVKHRECLERPEYVRGHVYRTGYYMTDNGDGKCSFVYLTQADMNGFIPSWCVNWVTSAMAPKFINSLRSHAKNYNKWKEDKIKK